jgi:hypothetical protein
VEAGGLVELLMRRLAAALAALWLALAAPPAEAAIAFVRNTSAGAGASAASEAATLSGVGAGDLIVVGLRWCADALCITTSAAAVSSVVDSSGDACAQATGAAGHSIYTVLYEDIWYCRNSGGGTETVTASFSGTVWYPSIYLSEYSGAAAAAPFDGAFNYGLNPGTSPSYSMTSFYVPTAGNTAQPGDLVYSIMYPTSGPTITPGNSALGGPDEYQIAGVPGPYMNSWTTSASPTAVQLSLATFKPAVQTTAGPIAGNVAQLGAYDDYSGGFEAPLETFENWLARPEFSLGAVDYSTYSFLCVSGATQCINNTFAYNPSPFSASRTGILVWSIGLDGCADTGCGSKVPLTGANSIASGFEDTVFNNAFAAIQTANPNAVIRLGWEMNLTGGEVGTSGAWSWRVGNSGGSTNANTQYVTAFQHVAAIAHSYGFKVDWCPNIGAVSGPAEHFYPGDSYVDYIGLDFYDLYVAASPAAAWSYYLTEPYGLYWHAAFAALHGKPLVYDEWGIGAEGDAQGAYVVAQMAAWTKSNNVAWLHAWNSSSSISVQICDNGTAGSCGAPYANPLSSAQFLQSFGGSGANVFVTH